ncbi:MAG: pyridoxal phosphate-dependent aminotransferase [Salibacteraceae bacterium]
MQLHSANALQLVIYLDLPDLMKNRLSDRIMQLAESETIAMAQRSRDLKAKGIDVINLSLGEPDFNTPDFIKEAAKKAIDNNITHYPPVAGFPELREAICRKFMRDNQLHYTPDQIVVSTGAKQSIMNAVLCLVNPGDEVVLPAPYWVSYREMVRYAGGVEKVIPTHLENDYKITPEQLDDTLTERSRLFIFSSPSNPTGSAYTEEELRQLAEVFARYSQVTVISDEIYEHIRYTGSHFSIARIDDLSDRVITVNGVSKAFAMTGWRIGYLAATPEVAKACIKIQGQFTSGASSISQMASLAAVEADPMEVKYMVDAFAERRKTVVDKVSKIPGFECNRPDGAFYLFPRIDKLLNKNSPEGRITTSSDLCMYLLSEAHVATVSGSAFGADDCIRLSYATSTEVLNEAIDRIGIAVEKLKP